MTNSNAINIKKLSNSMLKLKKQIYKNFDSNLDNSDQFNVLITHSIIKHIFENKLDQINNHSAIIVEFFSNILHSKRYIVDFYFDSEIINKIDKMSIFLKDIEKKGLDINNEILGTIFELLFIKKESKKHGSYYTPKNLSDSISKNIIDSYLLNKLNRHYNTRYKLLTDIFKNQDQQELEFLLTCIIDIKVIDPSLGSGNFLISIMNYLINLYTIFIEKQYFMSFKDIFKGKIKSNVNFELNIINILFLHIIPNSIHGIDINHLAVKISYIRLIIQGLLKSKSDDNLMFLNKMDFKSNLIHGNSLNNYEEMKLIGKFDIVIGNPPFGAKITNEEKKQLRKNFKSVKGINGLKGNPNTAVAFTELAGKLICNDGYATLILPKSLLYIESWKSLRYLLINNFDLISITDLNKSFDNVLLEQVIITFKINDNESLSHEYISTYRFNDETNEFVQNKVQKKYFRPERYLTTINDKNIRVYQFIIENSTPIGKIVDNHRGLVISKYIKKSEKEKDSNNLVPCLKGKDIQRYFIRSLSYAPLENIHSEKYFEYGNIIIQRIVAHVLKPKPHIILTATINPGLYTVDTIVNIYPKEEVQYSSKVLCLLLNSELVNWFTYHFIYIESIRSMDIFGYYLNTIPLPNMVIKYFYNKTLDILFDYTILLNTLFFKIKLKGLNKQSVVNFSLIGNCIIYCLFFNLENQLNNMIINLDRLLAYKFEFESWYKTKHFNTTKKWDINFKKFLEIIINVNNDSKLLKISKSIIELPQIKLIHSEF